MYLNKLLYFDLFNAHYNIIIILINQHIYKLQEHTSYYLVTTIDIFINIDVLYILKKMDDKNIINIIERPLQREISKLVKENKDLKSEIKQLKSQRNLNQYILSA